MASHGDVLEISVSHSIGNRTFFPKAGESNTFYEGGITVADDQGSITTSGELIVSRSRMAGMFTVMIENDQNIREDSVYLSNLAGASDTELAVWTISLVNGTVWQGSGVPVGTFDTDILAGTLTLKVNSGNFRKII